jgi:hypothetical protein
MILPIKDFKPEELVFVGIAVSSHLSEVTHK